CIMLQNNPRLKNLIVSLWNTLYGGGISNPLVAIEQITYLLFIKRLDELESKRERDAEFTGEKYKSKFSGKYTPWIDEMTYRPKPDATDEEKAELNKKRDEALKPRPRTELKWSYFKNMAPASDMLLHVRNN